MARNHDIIRFWHVIGSFARFYANQIEAENMEFFINYFIIF